MEKREDSPGYLVHDELPKEHEDPLIRFLHRIIRYAVKVFAVLMVCNYSAVPVTVQIASEFEQSKAKNVSLHV